MNRQLTFPGVDVDPYAGMTWKDKAAMILDQYPDTRDNDNVFTLRLAWAARPETPAFETWRRRRQEIQRNRSGAGYLRPSESVASYRRERDGAGPPRRRT